ncbi:MAG: hypothetical protein QNJ18_04675 [Xenococcaceae cyanobacterium MO_167.B52]|nr:hypothetical protein [Xenococcaceae cyanobacterium MO_167.B52]
MLFTDLTFPVKCFGQAPSPHKGRVILTNHVRELECQWESYDDVRDSPPDKQQLLHSFPGFTFLLEYYIVI